MKYFQNFGVNLAISKNEQILWAGKPHKKCFILESIFNPLLPFAIIWLLFDLNFVYLFSNATNANSEMINFINIFFLFHLMPVWIYLGGVFLTFLRYKNTEFAITDKYIHVSGGSICFFSKTERYDNIKAIQIKKGFFDQKLGVGDVVITLKTTHTRHRSSKNSHFSSSYQVNDKIEIIDVHDYMNVIDIIQSKLNELNLETEPPNEDIF